MVNYKEAIRIAGAFVGVIVGAGFASGQEVMQFFTSFGLIGLLGGVVATALFTFLAMALAALGQNLASSSHKRVIYAICGRYLGAFVDVLITFFMFAVAVVMIAGGGALLDQLFGIPQLWASIGVTVVTILIVCLDVRQVVNLIGSVTPLLVVMVVILAAATLFNSDTDIGTLQAAVAEMPHGAGNWLMAAVLYVSYNIVAGAPFLIIMGGQTTDRKTAIWGGILGGMLLGVLMLLIAGSMYVRADAVGDVAIPMLLLAKQLSPLMAIIMGLAIFGMILNTSVGVLYSFCARLLPPGTKKFRMGALVAGGLAFACSLVGFIKLVGTVYPFFGYLGFILMLATLVGWLRLRSGAPRSTDAAT